VLLNKEADKTLSHSHYTVMGEKEKGLYVLLNKEADIFRLAFKPRISHCKQIHRSRPTCYVLLHSFP